MLRDSIARDRARVLIVDDDSLFRNLLAATLRHDYLVAVASNGSEGYHKALEHPPDVAVLDVHMDGWDGLQTLNAFRAHFLLKHVAVMMVSADARREMVMSALQSGANDYLIKSSFMPETFLKKLSQLIKRQRAGKLNLPAPLNSSTSATQDANAAVPPAARFNPENLEAVIDDWS